MDVNETGTKTTRYIAGGALEIVTGGGQTIYKTTVGVAVIIDTIGSQSTTETRYLLKDHLGSTDVILDANGAVIDRMSFDAWGKRREVQWAAFLPVPASLWQTQLITRGFTGHEQLDQVGLVHMNGRVYDPELGRFLSADPFIQDVTNGQALNRYSYVLNNPLSFTDPSGFFFQSLFKAIGRAVGAVFRAIGRVFSALLKSGIFRAIIQIAACSSPTPVGLAACGAVSAGLTLATGGSLSDALTAGAIAVAQVAAFTAVGIATGDAHELVQIGTHGTVSGAFSVAQGGEFHTGFISGAVAKGTSLGVAETGLGQIKTAEGFYARTAIAATSGGVTSVLTGGKFFNGAVTAAFAHMYNQERKYLQNRTPGDAFPPGAQGNREFSAWANRGFTNLSDWIAEKWVNNVVSTYKLYDNLKSSDSVSLTQTKPPKQGPPSGRVDIDHTDGSPKQDRLYGPNGEPKTDYDYTHDHGSGKPHAHDWDNTGPEPVRHRHRPIEPGDTPR